MDSYRLRSYSTHVGWASSTPVFWPPTCSVSFSSLTPDPPYCRHTSPHPPGPSLTPGLHPSVWTLSPPPPTSLHGNNSCLMDIRWTLTKEQDGWGINNFTLKNFPPEHSSPASLATDYRPKCLSSHTHMERCRSRDWLAIFRIKIISIINIQVV